MSSLTERRGAAASPGANRSQTRAAAEQADAEPFPRRLEAILRILPSSELDSLVARMGIRIDHAKRIDAASQVARALVGLPDVRDPSRLPPGSCELLHRIAEAGGSLVLAGLTPALEPLIARGIVFGRRVEGGVELVLPYAFLVQLKSWESEDPRALRALFAQAPFEIVSAIASHYLGRPATPPVALSLEQTWELVSDPERLADEIAKLAPLERRLLESIEAVGGEVDTQELLDLEREPMRLRGAGGVTASRRGVGFALERRAFLIPIHPNRHVVPTEVASIVGAERRRARAERREEIRSFVLEEDHAPRRARFASDPAVLSVALAFAARDPGNSGEARPGVGTPKSLLMRLAQRFGRDIEASALITALSRAVGLWDASASSVASPPGSYPMYELSRVLFNTWRRGGAWDEARPEHEVYRLPAEARDSSPIGALRDMVLEALQDLGEGRWVPWQALIGYLGADERVSGLERLLRRWAERAGLPAPAVLEVARRIALETLPALGIIDLGGDPEEEAGIAIRLTPRGRALLSGSPLTEPTPSSFADTYELRIGTAALVGHVLSLAPFAEIARVGAELELLLAAPSIARALSAGLDGEVVRARVEAIAPLPEKFARMLAQASVVIGRASLAAVSAFLWVDDPEIRELLRTKRPAADLFVDPSPPGGLLVLPEVDIERLVRRCRALGVEIEVDGVALRTRSSMQVPAVADLRPAPKVRSKSPPPRR